MTLFEFLKYQFSFILGVLLAMSPFNAISFFLTWLSPVFVSISLSMAGRDSDMMYLLAGFFMAKLGSWLFSFESNEFVYKLNRNEIDRVLRLLARLLDQHRHNPLTFPRWKNRMVDNLFGRVSSRVDISDILLRIYPTKSGKRGTYGKQA